MAERRHNHHNPVTRPAMATSSSAPSNASGNVRRTLFHTHLSRRPTSIPTTTAAPSTATTSSAPAAAAAAAAPLSRTAQTAPADGSTTSTAETLRVPAFELSDASDIVIRDHNGEFDLGDVGLALGGGGGGGGAGGEGAGADDDGQDVEGMERDDEGGLDEKAQRQQLNEAVRQHLRDRHRTPSEPAELLEAVKSGLRAKVGMLDDDNWMFEGEVDDPKR